MNENRESGSSTAVLESPKTATPTESGLNPTLQAQVEDTLASANSTQEENSSSLSPENNNSEFASVLDRINKYGETHSERSRRALQAKEFERLANDENISMADKVSWAAENKVFKKYLFNTVASEIDAQTEAKKAEIASSGNVADVEYAQAQADLEGIAKKIGEYGKLQREAIGKGINAKWFERSIREARRKEYLDLLKKLEAKGQSDIVHELAGVDQYIAKLVAEKEKKNTSAQLPENNTQIGVDASASSKPEFTRELPQATLDAISGTHTYKPLASAPDLTKAPDYQPSTTVSDVKKEEWQQTLQAADRSIGDDARVAVAGRGDGFPITTASELPKQQDSTSEQPTEAADTTATLSETPFPTDQTPEYFAQISKMSRQLGEENKAQLRPEAPSTSDQQVLANVDDDIDGLTDEQRAMRSAMRGSTVTDSRSDAVSQMTADATAPIVGQRSTPSEFMTPPVSSSSTISEDVSSNVTSEENAPSVTDQGYLPRRFGARLRSSSQNEPNQGGGLNAARRERDIHPSSSVPSDLDAKISSNNAVSEIKPSGDNQVVEPQYKQYDQSAAIAHTIKEYSESGRLDELAQRRQAINEAYNSHANEQNDGNDAPGRLRGFARRHGHKGVVAGLLALSALGISQSSSNEASTVPASAPTSHTDETSGPSTWIGENAAIKPVGDKVHVDVDKLMQAEGKVTEETTAAQDVGSTSTGASENQGGFGELSESNTSGKVETGGATLDQTSGGLDLGAQSVTTQQEASAGSSSLSENSTDGGMNTGPSLGETSNAVDVDSGEPEATVSQLSNGPKLGQEGDTSASATGIEGTVDAVEQVATVEPSLTTETTTHAEVQEAPKTETHVFQPGETFGAILAGSEDPQVISDWLNDPSNLDEIEATVLANLGKPGFERSEEEVKQVFNEIREGTRPQTDGWHFLDLVSAGGEYVVVKDVHEQPLDGTNVSVPTDSAGGQEMNTNATSAAIGGEAGQNAGGQSEMSEMNSDATAAAQGVEAGENTGGNQSTSTGKPSLFKRIFGRGQ